MYAESRTWELVHSLQFASSVIVAFGLLALVHGLNVNSGICGLVNRFAAAAAVAVLALSGGLYAVDGVGVKEAAGAWVSGPPAEQPALFAAVQGVRGVEWGFRSYVAYSIGLTLILVAIVIVSTARVPRVIGYLMGLSGLMYVAVGVGYGVGYTALSPRSTAGSINYYLFVLVLIWAIWLLVIAGRMKGPDEAARGQLSHG